MRPCGVSTSTSGSSQNMPREPLRTNVAFKRRARDLLGNGLGDSIGADRNGRSIARDVDL